MPRKTFHHANDMAWVVESSLAVHIAWSLTESVHANEHGLHMIYSTRFDGLLEPAVGSHLYLVAPVRFWLR